MRLAVPTAAQDANCEAVIAADPTPWTRCFLISALSQVQTHTHTAEMQIFAMFYEGGVFILCAKATRLNDWNCVCLLCML